MFFMDISGQSELFYLISKASLILTYVLAVAFLSCQLLEAPSSPPQADDGVSDSRDIQEKHFSGNMKLPCSPFLPSQLLPTISELQSDHSGSGQEGRTRVDYSRCPSSTGEGKC